MRKFINTILLVLLSIVSFSQTIKKDFIEDQSLKENINYYEIIREINLIYKCVGVQFKCEDVYIKKSPFKHYNLINLSQNTTPPTKYKQSYGVENNSIAVYVTGLSEGEEIGAACVGGYFKSRSVVYIDFSYCNSLITRSNALAHEIGIYLD